MSEIPNRRAAANAPPTIALLVATTVVTTAAALLVSQGAAQAQAGGGASQPPIVAGPSNGRNDTANAVQRMFVNDQPVEPDVNPQVIRGKLVVPVRFVARYLGARTDWDARRRRVTFTTAGRPSRTLMMTVGSTRAMDNAQARIMETAPVIRDGRLLVPLREVERFFRAQVVYNPRNSTVFVKTARDSTVPEGTAAGRPNAPATTSPARTGGSAPAALPPPNPRGGN